MTPNIIFQSIYVNKKCLKCAILLLYFIFGLHFSPPRICILKKMLNKLIQELPNDLLCEIFIYIKDLNLEYFLISKCISQVFETKQIWVMLHKRDYLEAFQYFLSQMRGHFLLR